MFLVRGVATTIAVPNMHVGSEHALAISAALIAPSQVILYVPCLVTSAVTSPGHVCTFGKPCPNVGGGRVGMRVYGLFEIQEEQGKLLHTEG